MIDLVAGVLDLLLWSERRVAQRSHVGEAPFDRSVRRTYEQIVTWWKWIGGGFLLIAVILGCLWLV
jgi:hypothetical protein